MDDTSYVMFLLLGTALVLIDGQVIYRSGRRYLADSYADAGSAKSMARLVAVLFHFAVLGIVALISTFDFGGDTAAEAVVVRLGVVLLLLAVAHAVAIKVLTRLRDRLDSENRTKQHYENVHPVSPPDGVPVQDTVVAPTRMPPATPAPRRAADPRGVSTPEVR